MRPEHTPAGDPCRQCGMAAARHRKRQRDRSEYMRAWREEHPKERAIIGIDGEGWTTKDGRHLYTYLAACSSDALVSELYDRNGLKSHDVLSWILEELPAGALLVGYSLGYDRTKWLEGLPDGAIFSLYHPDPNVRLGWVGRLGPYGPKAITWGGFRLNLLSGRFTVGRADGKEKARSVWDVFRFYQTSFVNALRAWKVGTAEEVARIERMKKKRGGFHGIRVRERRYCQSECMLLAQLVTELVQAHEDEGLHLKSFFGPGSTASIVLKRAGAAEQRVELPPEVDHAVASAYFGGRFEVSHVGPVSRPLWGYDIASAYPYALARLPCFCKGKWIHVPRESVAGVLRDEEAIAVVSYRIEPSDRACPAWGPLPHRLPDGNIVFPIVGAGGWAWRGEVREAMRMHPGIVPLAAWKWKRGCRHVGPFAAEVVDLFCRRLAWGKAARGIVLKLALNSIYGKSAQHIGGGGQYRCMVRAGLITSHCRAQLLGLVQRAKDPWNVLELATDSVLSAEPLTLPRPVKLGTEDAARKAGKSPLGAWEEKEWPKGAMLLRPGLRFPLELGRTKEERERAFSSTAARGLGVRTMFANRRKVLRAWERAPMMPLHVQQPSQFHGAKSTVRCFGQDEEGLWLFGRDDLYGRWEEPKPRILSYSPGPKRDAIAHGDFPGTIALHPWELPTSKDARSVAYRPVDEEDALRVIHEEQPEAGYLEAF